MEKQKVKNLFKFLPKSKHKAGEGLENGEYPFYTSSAVVNKYLDEYDYDAGKLIFATGGSASVHYANSKFAVSTDNFILEPKEDVNAKYVYYYLKNNIQILQDGFHGAGLQHLSKDYLNEINIPILDSDSQDKIVSILDKVDEIRTKKRLANDKLDEFLKSTFITMFGDPVSNSKHITQYSISEIGTVITGNTPSRKVEEHYGDFIEWIKSDNINTPYTYLTQATEYLSEQGAKVGRIVPSDSILVTCIAGSFDCVGNIALTNRDVAFNQQINAIIPNKAMVNSYFLYTQLLIGKKLIQDKSTKSMKGMVSKGKFETIKVIVPTLSEQQHFADIFNNIEKQKQKNDRIIKQMNNLFNSLSQRAFNGELKNLAHDM